MYSRRATTADVPAIAELGRRWETHWFGAPEESEAEFREFFDRAEVSRVLLDDYRLVAAAWRAGDEAAIVVDPATAIVTFESGGAMLIVALPAPGWLQPVLDTLVSE